jgi:hypothetical protein
MDFTFGIITQGDNDHYISIIIDSIEKNHIPNYEIIIVGNTKIKNTCKIIIIEYDENIKPLCISRKKNIIVEEAKYENIVLIHDYIKFHDNWYKGFLTFGESYDFCVTKIKNIDGIRFRDYTLFPHKVDYLGLDYSCGDIDDYFNDHCLLPYHLENNSKINKYMYISGSYYIIKKSIGIRHKLDENLVWCRGDDVEYSKRLHKNGIFIKCNPYSEVIFLKQKESAYWEKEINEEKLQYLIQYCENE